MTENKPTLIDGVDVSGCEHHSINKNGCSLCSLPNNFICEYKPFCNYKQFKRKEQECKKLEQTLIDIKGIAKEQIPYLNIDESKTMIEIEYDYAGRIHILGQRMDKILQKISEVI